MMDPLDHLQALKDKAAGKDELKRIRALRSSAPGFDRDVWREMCAKGWLQLGVLDLCGVAEELGAGLVPEPLIVAAMAARLLPAEQLAPVLSGERVVLAAWQETPDGIDLVGQSRLRDGKLSGRKLNIPMAGGADAFLVVVQGGCALVERDARGVSLDLRETQDGGYLGTLTLDEAPAEAVDNDASDALEHAILAHATYLYGLTERALARTLDHIGMHDRSGQMTGSLEALRHRADDMQIQVSLTRGIIGSSVQALNAASTLAERRAVASRAKMRASDAATLVTRTCVQLHGGLGHTDVYDIALYHRKAMALAPLYGSQLAHRARIRMRKPETGDE